MKNAKRIVGAFLVHVFLAVALSAQATELRTTETSDDPGDHVLSHVEASFAHHAEAASGWYLAALGGRRVTEAQFGIFALRYLTGTFAEFQYTYTVGGVEHTRVYHGSSGTGEPPLGLAGVEPEHPVRDYFDTSDFAVVAGNVRLPDSQVTPSPVDDNRGPYAHAADAEIRIAQTLQRDIDEGIVPRGGILIGFVSQPMCTSCRAAVEQLTYQYGIETVVTTLARGGSGYRRFQGRRSAYMWAVYQHALARAVSPTNPPGEPATATAACAQPLPDIPGNPAPVSPSEPPRAISPADARGNYGL